MLWSYVYSLQWTRTLKFNRCFIRLFLAFLRRWYRFEYPGISSSGRSRRHCLIDIDNVAKWHPMTLYIFEEKFCTARTTLRVGVDPWSWLKGNKSIRSNAFSSNNNCSSTTHNKLVPSQRQKKPPAAASNFYRQLDPDTLHFTEGFFNQIFTSYLQIHPQDRPHFPQISSRWGSSVWHDTHNLCKCEVGYGTSDWLTASRHRYRSPWPNNSIVWNHGLRRRK